MAERVEYKFKAGDLVRLTWGGPVMRIRAMITGPGGLQPGEEPRIQCEWFDLNEAFHSVVFPLSELLPHTGPNPSSPRTPTSTGS